MKTLQELESEFWEVYKKEDLKYGEDYHDAADVRILVSRALGTFLAQFREPSTEQYEITEDDMDEAAKKCREEAPKKAFKLVPVKSTEQSGGTEIDLEKVRLAAQVKLEIQIRDSLAAELTRANARIEELEKEKDEFRTAFIEYRDEAINLRKMIDLYRKANGQ